MSTYENTKIETEPPARKISGTNKKKFEINYHICFEYTNLRVYALLEVRTSMTTYTRSESFSNFKKKKKNRKLNGKKSRNLSTIIKCYIYVFCSLTYRWTKYL